MSDPYSEDRVARFIESLPDETLCPPWADQQVDPDRVRPEEQGDHTSGAQLLEKQRDETETYFNQAVEGRETITTMVSSESLCSLLKAMGKHEWTAHGNKWEEGFIGGEDEDQAIWLRVHKKKVKDKQCQRLLMSIHNLWFLYQKAPSVHGMDQQTSGVHGKCAKRFVDLMHFIPSTVDKVCTKAHDDLSKMPDERRHAANTAESLRSQIIPLLLLVAKSVFMTGSQEKTGGSSQALPSRGTFTISAIWVLRQIMDWVKRLRLAMIDELEVNPPFCENADTATRRRESQEISKELRQLKLPNRHIKKFATSLTKAYEELEEEANRPKRKREAMEEDRRIRQKREDKKRMEEEAVERRMALFRSSEQASQARTSTQDSNNQEAESHGQRHRDADEDQYTQMPTSQGLAEVYPASNAHGNRKRSQKQNRWVKEERSASSQPSQSLPQGEARQKVSWSYEENNILLTLIRTTPQLSPVDLTEKLPGRNEQEIRQKIGELKETSRKFYKERGLILPKWC